MPEWLTILISISSSVGVTATGAWLLAGKLVDNRLKQQLEQKKGEIKKKVELELGDKAAQREYEFSAKKRLYSTIGPLKFQLLSACRDLSLHVRAFGLEGVCYSLEPNHYYGKSTLYRMFLPLVIAELIERQVAVADFSVDTEAIKLLIFKKTAYRAYKGDSPILFHPEAKWKHQEQHLFHHTISNIVDSFLVNEDGGLRPMYFKEFEASLPYNTAIKPLIEIIHDFSISSKPIFWIRLVFLADLCASLVNSLGEKAGFCKIELNRESLLHISNDDFTKENITKIVQQFDSLASEGL